jgi:hypothetical protein
MRWCPHQESTGAKEVRNMDLEKVKDNICDMVMHSEGMRVRPNELGKAVSHKYGMHRYVVEEVLKELLGEETLVFSYRDPCSFIEIAHARPRMAARPMVIIRDEKGDPWLCDKGVDPKGDLRMQGCWQCGGQEMPFTRND